MLFFVMFFSSKNNTYEELKFQVVEGIRVRVDTTEPAVFVFDNGKEFMNFLNEHASFPSKQKIPRIDFDKYLLVGVFSGRRPTGGYSIRIERVLKKDGTLLIHAVEECPKPGSMVIQVITYPSIFFTVEKFNLKEVNMEFEQCYRKKQIKKVKKSVDYRE